MTPVLSISSTDQLMSPLSVDIPNTLISPVSLSPVVPIISPLSSTEITINISPTLTSTNNLNTSPPPHTPYNTPHTPYNTPHSTRTKKRKQNNVEIQSIVQTITAVEDRIQHREENAPKISSIELIFQGLGRDIKVVEASEVERMTFVKKIIDLVFEFRLLYADT